MNLISETRRGFKSKFLLRCKMCNIEKTIATEKDEDLGTWDINTAVTLAAVSTGVGLSQIEELSTACNIPCMSDKTYQSCHTNVANVILTTAWKVMEEAGIEEASLAVQSGNVDEDGIPCITVVTDGAWAKRSYNVNYDSLSGVACIIGYKTGKLLHLGIRNKYCCVCARHENKHTEPPTHECYKNWSGTSTSMETDIVVEGFKMSKQLHGVKYKKMIGDGDSSVFRRLLEAKPYGNDLVEKIECKNHLLRNFCTRLREIHSRKRSNSKQLPVPPFLRKEVSNNVLRLRTSVSKAVHFRSKENVSFEMKIKNLEQDLKNAPSHVFGEHAQCGELAYFKCSPKPNASNFVPMMNECGLYDDIMGSMQRLIKNANSLILNVDNNVAEHYNSVVCKFVGGKRINFCLKGSYQSRCEAAAISYNSGSQYYRRLHKIMAGRSPNLIMKKYVSRLKKQRSKLRLRKRLSMNKKQSSVPDKDYGPEASFITLPLDSNEYLEKQKEFMEKFKKTNYEIASMEEGTIGQATNSMWVQERSLRLTASHFGLICKMRSSTKRGNAVKNILYSNFFGNSATRYGVEHESQALIEFQERSGLKVRPCGLFISSTEYYLGASPDGIVEEEDAIVEIKCPSSLAKISPSDGIANNIISFFEVYEGEIRLKRRHNYYFQVQGQLAISKRKWCYFCVWSPFGIVVEKIQHDEELWNNEMLPKLKEFYMRYMLPELVDPQHPRSLPIRD